MAGDTPVEGDFRGRDWSIIYPDLDKNRCNALEIIGAPRHMNPPECADYNVTLTLPTHDTRIFWTAQEDADGFRVFWNGQEIGRCVLVTQFCTLRLP